MGFFLFDAIKSVLGEIVPAGTVVGDLIGSTKEKGSPIFGIKIGDNEYTRRYEAKQKAIAEAQAVNMNPPEESTKPFIIGLVVILGGFLLFTTLKK